MSATTEPSLRIGDVAADQGVADLDQGQASREEKDCRSKADPEQSVRFLRKQCICSRGDRHGA